MSSAVRVSQHNGRGYSNKHNDRNFDTENAPHIDAEKTPDNINWMWSDDVKTFAEAELLYYETHFTETLEKTNDNYIRNGHQEHCKTIHDVLEDKNAGIEEVILQIGDLTDNVPPEVFTECALEYFDHLQKWNEKTGNHMAILDMAIHLDEKSPHMQMRRVWQYQADDSGRLAIGQKKALEQAGIFRPEPNEFESRHNNNKMTFDKMMREKWIEIVEAHGFEVEKKPMPTKTHADKAAYIREQEQGLADMKSNANLQAIMLNGRIIKLNVREASLDAREASLDTREASLDTREGSLSDQRGSLDADVALYQLNLEEDVQRSLDVLRPVMKAELERKADARVAQKEKALEAKYQQKHVRANATERLVENIAPSDIIANLRKRPNSPSL